MLFLVNGRVPDMLAPLHLPHRHRILTLLGITDKDDLCSPSEDGWFCVRFLCVSLSLIPIISTKWVFPRPVVLSDLC